MGSIKQLCTNLLLLSNGNVSFQGSVDVGINQYLETKSFKISTIKSGIKYLHQDLEIIDITINSSSHNVFNISSENNCFNLRIYGKLKFAKKIAVELRIFDLKKNIVALYSPGQLEGELFEYGPGHFEINEKVCLPSNLTKGEFVFDIDLIYPNVEGYMNIPFSTKIISEGIVGKTGIEFNYNENGLLIL